MTMIAVVFLFVISIGIISSNEGPEINHDQRNPSNLVCESNLVKYAKRELDCPEDSSIIYGLSKHANKEILNQLCLTHLKAIESGITEREPWATKVKDSSGAKESAFIWGHSYWLGNKQGCAAVQEPLPLTLSPHVNRTIKEGLINQLAPFKMDFMIVYLQHDSPWFIETKVIEERVIHVGLCIPSSCSSSEIQNLTQSLLDKNLLEHNNALEYNAKVIHVKDLKLKPSFFEQKIFKITIACVMLPLIMSLAAWFMNDSKQVSVVKCFDIFQNTREFLSLIEPPPKYIPIINGLKTISCNCIIIYHVPLYMLFVAKNKAFSISSFEKLHLQPIAVSPLLVDLLFSISGFLQAYLFIGKESNLVTIRRSSFAQNTKIFLLIILHRYLRLVPVYFIVATMTALFTSYAQDVSVFHITDRYDQICSKYWWQNALLIQNLFEFKELCLNWLWSLACEMQFFYVGLILLFVYAKYPQMAKNLTITTLVATIIYSYIKAIKIGYQFSFDMGVLSCNDLYINPIVRIIPFLIGLMGGWYLARRKENVNLNPTTEKFMWKLTSLIFFGCMYSQFKRDLSPFNSISLLIWSRVLIGIAGCWMLVASALGSMTWWSRILEWKFFQVTGRLSYVIYLLNPALITMVFSLSDQSFYSDPYLLMVLMCGFCVVTNIVAVVFYVAFEVPVSKLSILLLRKNTKTA